MPTIDPKKKERFAELVGLGATQPEAAKAVSLHPRAAASPMSRWEGRLVE